MFGYVFPRYFLADDVPVEPLHNSILHVVLEHHQQVVRKRVELEIPLDVALDIQKQGPDAVSSCQRLDVARDHSMQKQLRILS